MKKYLKLATATAVVLGCTACSSSSHGHPKDSVSLGSSATTQAASGGASVATPSATPSATSGDASVTGARASGFCDLARKVGKANLGVSAGNLDPDPKKLLTQVDQLDAVAPPELKKDFDVFAGFEHTVLEPGTARPSPVRGDPTAALEHVSSYFVTVCKIR